MFQSIHSRTHLKNTSVASPSENRARKEGGSKGAEAMQNRIVEHLLTLPTQRACFAAGCSRRYF